MTKITYKNRVFRLENDSSIMYVKVDNLDDESIRELIRGAYDIDMK